MAKLLEGLKKFIQGIMAAGLATWTFSWIPADAKASVFPAMLLFYAAAFGIYAYFDVKQKKQNGNGGG